MIIIFLEASQLLLLTFSHVISLETERERVWIFEMKSHSSNCQKEIFFIFICTSERKRRYSLINIKYTADSDKSEIIKLIQIHLYAEREREKKKIE